MVTSNYTIFEQIRREAAKSILIRTVKEFSDFQTEEIDVLEEKVIGLSGLLRKAKQDYFRFDKLDVRKEPWGYCWRLFLWEQKTNAYVFLDVAVSSTLV